MPPAKVRQVCKDFYGYSTLHGLHFLFDSPWMIRRLLWLLFLAGATGAFGYFAAEAYAKYLKHEVFITTKYQPEEHQKFPLVTICNQNMLKKSKIMGKDGQRYLDGLISAPRSGKRSKLIKEMNKSFEIDQEVQKNGHQFKDMVKELKFSSLCPGTGGRVNFKVAEFLEIRRGLCHTVTIDDSVTKLGESYGLSLMLDAEPHEYYGPFSSVATGLKLMVHAPDVYPIIEQDSIDIPPGFKTTLRIRKRKKIYKEHPYPKNCRSKKLKKSDVYSTSRCQMEHFSYETGEQCGCRIIGQQNVSENTKRLCGINETVECVFPFLFRKEINSDECPTNCTEEEYEFQSSTLRYPSESAWEDLMQGRMQLCDGNYNVSSEYKKSNGNNDSFQDWYRKRYARINIFFYTKDVEVVEEIPAFDGLDFAGNLGGNMGLYLGCSFLTLVEFIDLLVLIIIQLFKKDRKVAEKWAEKQTNSQTEDDN